MATLKNTTIDDTGFIKIATGTTAQRPSSPQGGMARFNTTLGVFEYYNGSEWTTISAPLGSFTNPALNAQAIKTANPAAPSGNYWIKPTGFSTAYEIYCDMTNQSGGWMLVAVGREGRQDDAANRDWWRTAGDSAGAWTSGLKEANLSGSGNYNPRYASDAWIKAACGNTWNEVEMIINRIELGDSYYFRTAANNFSWADFESSPAPFNLTYNRYTGQWLSGTNSYGFTNTNWTDTLSNGGSVSNDATRLFTWTWSGHASPQYTGWSAGSSVTSPGFQAGSEGHALQMVNCFVR